MDQPVGRITQLRLYPIRPLWSLGPGWAAVSGGLAVGGFALSPEILLNLLLVWLVADPVLGMIWDLGVGDPSPSGQGGIWSRLLSPHFPVGDLSPKGTYPQRGPMGGWVPAAAPFSRFLPYTQPGSHSRRLADRLGRLCLWWQGTFPRGGPMGWPEAGREFAALVAALGLALLLGAILGRNLLVLVLFSIALSWLVALSQKRDTAGDSTQRATDRQGIVALGYVLGEFGTSWLIGSVVMGRPSWTVMALGVCYTITYFGFIHHAPEFWLIATSQATVALLLAGLRHPLAAGAIAILLMPQWGLRAWGTSGSYLRGVQPFVILSILIAAVAVAL